MRQLVKAQEIAPNQIAVCRRGAKKHRLFAEECSSGMLHTAISESGNQDQVIFGKRKRLGKIISQELHAILSDLLQLGSFLSRPLILRLAHINPRQIRCLMHFLEWSGGKGEQICT